jgi:hypothetical protein
MAANIIPSITTTNKDITKIQLKELKNYKTQNFGLFLTGLKNHKERMELLNELKKYQIVFPFVHLRIDSTPEEVEFCLKHLGTEWFNLHGDHKEKFIKSDIYKYKNKILAENSRILNTAQLEHFAGICLDLSHYFEDLINDQEHIDDLHYALKNYQVVANHISAIKIKNDVWSEHIGNYLEDFDYLKKIPTNYFGTACSCMELENTIEAQMKFIDYINNFE